MINEHDGSLWMMAFKNFSVTLRNALKRRGFSERRVDLGWFQRILGSQDRGWLLLKNDDKCFVGRERDYWMFTYASSEDASRDIIEEMGVGIDVGEDGRHVDSEGLNELTEWVRAHF
ncbi:hypothetical protein [Maricaulis parjimensis]|uniref:hypothetical protein n=1 Tax=Maricaulis parjimensis TaxID=144023 RepID=UPI00193A7123|nr:hypothetical protein [Maricaulis parjimensis]